MHPSNLEQKLTQRHKDWIRIAKSFGAGDYSEDLVQEMYIRVLKYIRNGKIFPIRATSIIYTFIRCSGI